MRINKQSKNKARCTRREFLATTAVAASAVAPNASAERSDRDSSADENGTLERVSEHLFVYHGAVNIGIIRDDDRVMLIDCGDTGVRRVLREMGISKVARVLITHCHRDQVCAVGAVAPHAQVGVPAGERQLLAKPADYWADDKNLYRVYKTFRPDHLTPIEPIRVDETLADGDQRSFGSARLRVLDTPGHTDGSVSYQVNVDGKCVVFCGDTICGDGKLWDIYSLQRGFQRGKRRIGGYHGFMGDQWRLRDSLKHLGEAHADMLVPAHGAIVRQPAAAIARLAQRLKTGYENYVSISALRHYFPELFTEFAGRPGQMPIRPGIRPPTCLRHFGTTWMLVARSGAALVMDVGSPAIVKQLKQLLVKKEIKRIDALWVTHYHFDHTDGIPEFQKEFDCTCIADRRLAPVLTDPARWRLPCLAPAPIRVDRKTEDGESWTWEEFKLTAFFFPGQTMYHDALLVESGKLRMLFVGDSHTMAGIDDYCAYNRNLLGRGVGFQYCLTLIEKLQPTHMFNCHVADAFTFTTDEIHFMRKTLDQRERLFGQLVPWEHANYGLDPSWVRAAPYLQRSPAGKTAEFNVVITNHANHARPSAVRAVPPVAWAGATGKWVEATARAREECRLPVSVIVPPNTRPGRYVVAIDVRHGNRSLPQFSEAIVDVTAD